MIAEGGRRERKKQQTRELIAETARRLFEERGFEAVTVAEIAREADVAEKTVFNYFPTKEDLFYNRMESFEEDLLATIRDRGPGVSVLEAFRRFIDQPRGVLAEPRADEARERLARISRVITQSPALQAREQQVLRRYTESLAALIAEDAGAAPDDVRPWVAANALMGIHRSLIELVRTRTLAGGDDPAALARDLRAHADRAFALLESGLGDYAPGRER
jgi:AcrR family transcriptional regulator